jgi:hypothetical protein
MEEVDLALCAPDLTGWLLGNLPPQGEDSVLLREVWLAEPLSRIASSQHVTNLTSSWGEDTCDSESWENGFWTHFPNGAASQGWATLRGPQQCPLFSEGLRRSQAEQWQSHSTLMTSTQPWQPSCYWALLPRQGAGCPHGAAICLSCHYLLTVCFASCCKL